MHAEVKSNENSLGCSFENPILCFRTLKSFTLTSLVLVDHNNSMRVKLRSLLSAFGIIGHAVTTVAFLMHPITSPFPARHRTLTSRLYVISLPQSGQQDRFERTATTCAEIDQPCILTIHNKTYDLTGWAKAHPGGVKVLQRFHGKDASKAFAAAGHSRAAYEMLKDFVIASPTANNENDLEPSNQESPDLAVTKPRWRVKLFTKEDPIGFHKYAGVFALLHFTFRYAQLYFGGP